MNNNQKRNYQKELDSLIASIPKATVPTLLLHACCAPCSSYTTEYLSQYFRITIFYYNPNIYPPEEYKKRVGEIRRFFSCFKTKNPIDIIEGEYIPQDFFNAVKGMENIPEGGERCFVCYRQRLEKTAQLAQRLGYDYFASTLSISPYKNALKLNEISEELSEIYSVKNLPNDFKKKGGYKRSIELSAEYSLYRQDYCGCVFSKEQREREKKGKIGIISITPRYTDFHILSHYLNLISVRVLTMLDFCGIIILNTYCTCSSL